MKTLMTSVWEKSLLVYEEKILVIEEIKNEYMCSNGKNNRRS